MSLSVLTPPCDGLIARGPFPPVIGRGPTHATSSSSNGRPSPSASGTRQLGYSSIVPGWLIVRRSPTASATETPTRRAGVSVSRRWSASTWSCSPVGLSASAPSTPEIATLGEHRPAIGIVDSSLLGDGSGQQPEPLAQVDVLAGEIAGRRRQVVGGHRRQAHLAPLVGRQRLARPGPSRTTAPTCRGCRAGGGSPASTVRPCRGPRRPRPRRRGGPRARGSRPAPRGRIPT